MQARVVPVAHADEDAATRAAGALRRLPCVLQRFPADLEQQPLLRVHASRLPRRDAEELGIEVGDSGQEATPALLVVPARGGMVAVALGGEFDDRVSTFVKQPPEGLGTFCAGEAAADADDGDRLAAQLRGRVIGDGGGAGQMVGQGRHAGVVIGQGGRQRTPEPALQVADQIHRGQRVEAVAG